MRIEELPDKTGIGVSHAVFCTFLSSYGACVVSGSLTAESFASLFAADAQVTLLSLSRPLLEQPRVCRASWLRSLTLAVPMSIKWTLVRLDAPEFKIPQLMASWVLRRML